MDLIFLVNFFCYSVQFSEFCQICRRTDQHDLIDLSGLKILEARHLLAGADAGFEDGFLVVWVVGFLNDGSF